MTQTVTIFGRLPKISLAEVESLYGADKITPLSEFGALIDLDPTQIDFSRLGGTVKFCKLLTILESTKWHDIQKFLEDTVPEHVGYLPDGKLRLGLSVYGLNTTVRQINATALGVKKVIKATGRSVRVIPNKELALNSAQILHNQLTGPLGWELIFIRDGNKTIVAQNIAEQDIEAYGKRDQGRPKRDARVGMLPPKLAQTIVNLAVGRIENVESGIENRAKTILDPFCGTGVLLQEALLMGYEAHGTDIEPRMVEYSNANLEWLKSQQFNHCAPVGVDRTWQLEAADATSHNWKHSFDFVASEAYLGQPFSTLPAREKLEEVRSTTNTIIKKFLNNLASQTRSGFRLCLAVPTWQTPDGILHLPTLDHLEELGYTRLSFVHAEHKDLIYYREGQIVARELLVLKRK